MATIFNYCSNRGNMPLLRYGSGQNAAGMIHCYATLDATFRRSGLQPRLLRWPQFLTIAAIAAASRSYVKIILLNEHAVQRLNGELL